MTWFDWRENEEFEAGEGSVVKAQDIPPGDGCTDGVNHGVGDDGGLGDAFPERRTSALWSR